MKKTVCTILCLLFLMSAFGAVTASAADPVHPVDRALVYNAAYGTPIVDGEMDDIYLQSDVMYAENASFGSSASVKEGQNATAEYRIVWNKTTLFIFCTVTDPTRSAAGATGASATKMDNTDIYVMLDAGFATDKDYSDRTVDGSGQFRYQPNCTIDKEPNRAASWGKLTVRNQLAGTYNYVGGYLNETDGSYSFEMCFNYSVPFTKTIAANIKTRTATAIGFGMQINDVMDDDASRDALVYSNNAKGGLSSNLNNCGKVMLAFQEGVEIPDDPNPPAGEDTTEEQQTTEEKPPVTTDAPEEPTTPAKTETKAPATSETTGDGKKPEKEGGCKSSIGASLGCLLILTAAGACAAVCKRKH